MAINCYSTIYSFSSPSLKYWYLNTASLWFISCVLLNSSQRRPHFSDRWRLWVCGGCWKWFRTLTLLQNYDSGLRWCSVFILHQRRMESIANEFAVLVQYLGQAFGQGNSLRAAQCLRLPAACRIGLGWEWKESWDTKSAGFRAVPSSNKPAYWFNGTSSSADTQQQFAQGCCYRD